MKHIHVCKISQRQQLESRQVTSSSARQWFQALQLTSWYFISTLQPRLCCRDADQSCFTTRTVGQTVWLQSTAITRTGVTQSLTFVMATIQLSTTYAAAHVLHLKRFLASTQYRSSITFTTTRLHAHKKTITFKQCRHCWARKPTITSTKLLQSRRQINNHWNNLSVSTLKHCVLIKCINHTCRF